MLASLAVLAGGQSVRMGKDKALLDIAGRKLLARVIEELDGCFAEVLIVTRGKRRYDGFPARLVADLIPGRGPLSGIHAALSYARYPYTMVVACDMPFVSRNLARLLLSEAEGYDAVIPLFRSRPEPLFAVYHKNCLEPVERCLQEGRLRAVDFHPYVRVKYVPETLFQSSALPEEVFFNVNYPEDLARARQMAAAKNGGGRPPVLCITGTSKTGKTTLVEGLIRELVARGYRVGTVKHCPHDITLDAPGKDSWRHAEAGATVAAVDAPGRLAVFRAVEYEMTLSDVVGHMSGVDLVLAEGYKRESYPKFVVGGDAALLDELHGVLAVVGYEAPAGLPVFAPDDYAGMADFIEETLLGRRKEA